MTSKKHDEILRKQIKKYKDTGARVIRLDKRGVPDAIIITIAGNVVALEVETTRNHFWHAKNVKGNLNEFDGVYRYVPKPKSSHSSEKYYEALKLRADGKKLAEIANKLKVSIPTVHYWCSGQFVPIEVKDKHRLDNERIIYY